jgi:hypothetical protein
MSEGVLTPEKLKELEDLPDDPPRSKLAPYLSFILALRARNPPMSYVRIAKLLGEKCNCRISAPSLREYAIRHRSKK